MPKLRLRFLTGPRRGQQAVFTGPRVTIGRSRDNTVVIPNEDQASRLHARLYFENGRWLLRDFGLNGTRIDSARVNQVAELADGNEIRIGSVRFRFQLPDQSRTVAKLGPSTDLIRPQPPCWRS